MALQWQKEIAVFRQMQKNYSKFGLVTFNTKAKSYNITPTDVQTVKDFNALANNPKLAHHLLALAFGQSRVGGSRVDYAVNDILHAFNNHINITKISHDYLQSLSQAIQKQAINPDRELDTINLLTQIMPDL